MKEKEREREHMKERKREGERELSIFRHDFSEDTAACCGYWGAVQKRDAGRKRVRERARRRQQRRKEGQRNGRLVQARNQQNVCFY